MFDDKEVRQNVFAKMYFLFKSKQTCSSEGYEGCMNNPGAQSSETFCFSDFSDEPSIIHLYYNTQALSCLLEEQEQIRVNELKQDFLTECFFSTQLESAILERIFIAYLIFYSPQRFQILNLHQQSQSVKKTAQDVALSIKKKNIYNINLLAIDYILIDSQAQSGSEESHTSAHDVFKI